MDAINKLEKIFAEFPGIGPRQAKRFVYFLLSRNQGFIDELTSLLPELRKQISVCRSCFRFFPRRNGGDLCQICSDNGRDKSSLLIVARDIDLDAIEKSRMYHGKYFVLGGTVPILEERPETRIRLRELIATVKTSAENGLKEIIIAMNATADGEHTHHVLMENLEAITSTAGIKISALGRGLSTGTELEYSDNDTIRNALENRK